MENSSFFQWIVGAGAAAATAKFFCPHSAFAGEIGTGCFGQYPGGAAVNLISTSRGKRSKMAFCTTPPLPSDVMRKLMAVPTMAIVPMTCGEVLSS